jgi:hypothetical protein
MLPNTIKELAADHQPQVIKLVGWWLRTTFGVA